MQLQPAKIQTFTVAGTKYRGANPIYMNVAQVGQPANYIKVAKGVPFVRVG